MPLHGCRFPCGPVLAKDGKTLIYPKLAPVGAEFTIEHGGKLIRVRVYAQEEFEWGGTGALWEEVGAAGK